MARASDTADLTEFQDVGEASAFGWKPTSGSSLMIVPEAENGSNALRVEARADTGPYQGVELLRTIDLSDAGPQDTIAFNVKQNFGHGMRMQIWTEQGGVSRTFQVPRGKWIRVELDLDPANWESSTGHTWGKVTQIQLYAKAFNSEHHYMMLDGLTITTNGQRTVPMGAESVGEWRFPRETNAEWRLGNAHAAWAISKTTGQIEGGWDAQTRSNILIRLEGSYHLENRESLVTGHESDDRVLDANFIADQQRLELTCTNPAVPDLTIRKQYWIDGNKLYQRIAFKTSSDRTQFITYNTQAIFDPAYRKAGYYMGGGDGGWPLIPAPNPSGWQKVLAYRNTTKGMVLSQSELNVSFAHVRTRLDDTFVWPWFTGAIATYCEPSNVLHYTPDGWDMSLGTSKLSTTEETSFEQYVSLFEGDWQTFLTAEYPALPEVKQAYEEIPSTPDWVADIVVDTSSDMDRIRRLLEVTDEGYITVLVDLGSSWADYYVDQGVVGLGGGWIKGEEIRNLIQHIKALSPRVKVGLYMWTLSTFENTRIYQQHPEWFRTTNKRGDQANTFPGFATNFAQLLSIPDAYDELLSQFDLVLTYLDTDFIYLDDPKAINPIDWDSGEYTRDDLCFKFFLDIKRIAAKHGPDKMVFFNNMCNPYGDVNYIEGRGEINPNYWRHFAGNVTIAETNSRPQSRITLLYYIAPYEREYINRVLAMGWIPEMAYGNVLHRRAFIQAAYEVGNSRVTTARYTPDWKRDKDTNLESYVVQREGDAGQLLSLISHEETRQTIPIDLELDTFGLNPNQPVYVWQYRVEDANNFKGSASARLVREIYQNVGWQLDRVTHRKLVYAGPYQEHLELSLKMEPLSLYQLYVTSLPFGVYSENHLPNNYLFGRKPNVTLEQATGKAGGDVEIVINSDRDDAEIVGYFPLSRYNIDDLLLDGRPVDVDFVWEGNDVFPVVDVSKGRHVLTLSLTEQEQAPDIEIKNFDVQATSTSIDVATNLNGRAVLTVQKGGRVLYNRLAESRNGVFHLPVSPARDGSGEYAVSLRAVMENNGQVRLAVSPTTGITLDAATIPDMGLTPTPPAIMPGEQRTADIARDIRDAHILGSATSTTDSLRGSIQPDLPTLMAHADSDTLSLEAGRTRKMDHRTNGAAFAGFEIQNLHKIKVRLSNTFHNAFHNRGVGIHIPRKPNSSNFAGIVVDYHTAKGYTHRVRFGVGVMHPECSSTQPGYGKAALADGFYDLGVSLVETPETVFSLDLERYAPEEWDGQVWFSVGTDWVSADRRLTLQILDVNDGVQDEIIVGTNPKAYKEAYEKPRSLNATRNPGGVLIDGPSNEEWWGGAAITGDFFFNGGSGVSHAKTTAKVMYDDTSLYVAFICQEPDRDRPLIQGGALWDDDEVEVWIDTNGDGKTYKQIIVNAANEKMELSESGAIVINTETAVYVAEDGSWLVEMRIPFKGLNVQPPQAGDTWRVNLCRFRPAGPGFNSEEIVWAALQNPGFKDLENFGPLNFK